MWKILRRSRRATCAPPKTTGSGPAVDPGAKTSRPVHGNVEEKGLKKIHRAALNGDFWGVEKLLNRRKHALNELDSQRRTPLHLAAAHGHTDVVFLLVQRKCDLDLCDAEDRTALMMAVQSQKEDCVCILLEHGADPNILDVDFNSALHYAVDNENESIITKLLLYKANIEARDQKGCTPLLYAVKENKQKIIEFLLSKGANINAVDYFGSSALAYAACRDSADTVHVLLRHGIDCSSEDCLGRTAAQCALFRGFINNHKIILEYESKKDKQNQTNEKDKQEERKENDQKKEENDLAKENAHKDTEKRLPMKLIFEDSCSTIFETVDFEAKVKEGKKHESSDMILEDISDSDSVSSGLNLQVKSGRTDNQRCSIAMTKDPYRCPGLLMMGVKTNGNIPWPSVDSMDPASVKAYAVLSGSEEKKRSAAFAVDVEDRRFETDATSRVPDKQDKPSLSDSRLSTKSAGLASTEPVVIPENVDSGRHEQDKTVTSRVPDKQNKPSQSDSRLSTQSADVAGTKPFVIPENVDGERRESDKTVTRALDTGKKITQHDSASLPGSEVLASTKPVVIPVNVDSGRHEPDKNGTRTPPVVLKNLVKKQNNDLSPSSKSVGQMNKRGPALPVNVDSRSHDPAEITKRKVVKERKADSCSSPYPVGEANEKAGAELSVNVYVRRDDPDENVKGNIPGWHKNGVKTSKNETYNSAVSVPKVSRKTGALHSVTGESRRHKSRQKNGSNVYNFFLYRFPGLTRKKETKSTNEMCMPSEPLTVTHETAGIAFPEQGDSRRHEKDQDVGRPVQKTSNEKKEINPTDDSDDITQTSETVSMGCDSLHSERDNYTLLTEQLCRNCKESAFSNISHVSKCQDLISPHKRSSEIKDNQFDLLMKKYRKVKNENCALKQELLEAKVMNSQLKEQSIKQEYCCYNLRDQLQREEEYYRSDVQVKQQLESTLSAVAEGLRALRSDFMKASLSHEREKDPVHKSHALQGEISVLKLEMSAMRNQNQEQEKTIEIIKEMNDFLRKTIQVSEERLAKTISEHYEQLLVLKSENKSLSTQLEYEKQNSETLKREVESCRGRLDAAVQDCDQSHKSERDLERHLQRTREERLHLEERLSHLQRENMLLQQQLNEAQKKADTKEETLVNIRGQLQDSIRRLQTENKKQKETNKELTDEYNHLKIRLYKYEEEKAAREAQITPQENLKLSRGTQTNSISQIEVRNTNLETENCRLKAELESQRIKLEKYMQLHLEESNTRKSLQNSVNTDIKARTEVNSEPLVAESSHDYVSSTPPLRPELLLSDATYSINRLHNILKIGSYVTKRQHSTTFPAFDPMPQNESIDT